MIQELSLRILSPSQIKFEGKVTSVHIPAALGEVEILFNHTAFVSSLLPGFITVNEKTQKDRFFVTDGYVEVNNNEVTLIVDDIMDASEANDNYFTKQIESLTHKLSQNLNDNEYEKVTASIALYKQYIA